MPDGIVLVYIKGLALNFTALKATIIEYGKENEHLAEAPIPYSCKLPKTIIVARDRQVGPCNKGKRKLKSLTNKPIFIAYVQVISEQNFIIYYYV